MVKRSCRIFSAGTPKDSQDLFHTRHECCRSAKKESPMPALAQMLFDQRTIHVAACAKPFRTRPARDYHGAKPRQPFLQVGKVLLKNDIVLSADGIEQRDLSIWLRPLRCIATLT